MKDITIFECADGKSYELAYNVRGLRQLERALGRSFFDFFAKIGSGSLQEMTLDFTINALRFAMHECSEERAIDIIEAHCDNGGTLDDINGVILKAVMSTGFFMPKETETQATA